MTDSTNQTSPETENNENTTNNNLDFDLDFNLPEIKKNDNRLEQEDSTSKEQEQNIQAPTIPQIDLPTETETPAEIEAPTIPQIDLPTETETPAEIEAPTTPQIDLPTETETPAEIEAPTIPQIDLPTETETPAEIKTPSTSIEELPTAEKNTKENIIEPTTLQEDMTIVNELQQASIGTITREDDNQKNDQTTTETPKTFDLDNILLSNTNETTNTNQTNSTETQPSIQTPQESPIQQIEIQQTPQQAIPAFTLPPQQPTIQNDIQTIPSHKNNIGIKIGVFSLLFVALGFTSYFILQTMYPLEMNAIFNRDTEPQMHAASDEEIEEEETLQEEILEEEILEEEIPEEENKNQISIEEETLDTDISFGELNDLGTPKETNETTHISKLAEYVNQGNKFWETGKEINNNTVIKYGLYIKTKATDFLEKIAKGEEIPKLDAYFAQFDQYTKQLEEIIGTNTTTQQENSISSQITTEDATQTNEFGTTTSE